MNELPQRKPTRLKGYDYTRNGAYFVTVCVKDRAELLGTTDPATVGGGVPDAPPFQIIPPSVPNAPHVQLSPYGDVVAKTITDICSYYENIEIPHYIIMPNHIHMIILVSGNEGIGTLNRGTGRRGRRPLRTWSYRPRNWRNDCFYNP